MTIANELQLLQTNLTASYTACNDKGATMPVNQNFSNLASCIDTIPTGGGGGIDTKLIVGDVDANGVYKRLSDSTDITGDITLSGIKSISSTNYAFSYKFALITSTSASDMQKPQSRGIVGVISFPDLETVSSNQTFQYCFYNQKITGISFPKLATVSGGGVFTYTFRNCKSLTTVSFPSLATLTGATAFSSAFQQCTSLTSLSFPALTSNSFGSNNNQFNSMLSGVRGCTVHFPSNIQSTIGSWSSVTGGFGGTNTTVLFDLPATE